MSATPQDEDVQPKKWVLNAFMLMHLTLPYLPVMLVILLFVWFVTKHSQAIAHGKNILNAYITLVIVILAISPVMQVLVYHPDIQIQTGFAIPEFVLITLSIIMGVLGCIFSFAFFYSVILVAIAARKGKVLPYFWAIRFFKI
jgi:uncharacterized Tic20 family protein